MVLKGTIAPDHIPVNNFELIIAGLPPITFVEVSGLPDEIETVQLPDRTMASGGNSKALELTAKIMAHHIIEVAALDLWWIESGGLDSPVLPTYKKLATLINRSISGLNARVVTLTGMFPKKRKTSDLKMDDEGKPAEIEYTFSVDLALPVP